MRLAAVALVGALVSGCGVQIPTDPEGSLDAVRASGELRVGVSPNPPFTSLPEGEEGPPAGTEVERITGFARSLGAEPVFVGGGEESLMKQLDAGELDVVIGGLTEKSPWSSHAALTRPYLTTPEDGKQVKHVMAVVMGENALLSELERYLDGEG